MSQNSYVINLGCRLNSYESEVIKDILKKNKVRNITVINSCAVTNQAVQKSKSEIRKAKIRNPGNKIIVTGCASHIDPNTFSEMTEVNRIINNKFKTNAILYTKTIGDLVEEEKNKLKLFPEEIKKIGNKTRALLQIQQGCDHRCTFCAIPYGRGDSVSLPLGEIVRRTEVLLESGYREITITGVDITSYGLDLPGKPNLGLIIKRLLNMQPLLKRIRFSSIDPAELDEDLLELIMFDERVLPHIHLSTQSGDNLILKRMKRRHNREYVINLCKKIKDVRPEVTFGTDIIVGFPTETEKNFLNTLNFVKKCMFSNLHVFPFSPKNKTPAAKMPQVIHEIKLKRSKKLRFLGETIKQNKMKKKIGSKARILFENKDLSYTDDYFKVKVTEISARDSQSLKGKFIDVVFKNCKNDHLEAKLL